jgi:hypothetical protein
LVIISLHYSIAHLLFLSPTKTFTEQFFTQLVDTNSDSHLLLMRLATSFRSRSTRIVSLVALFCCLAVLIAVQGPTRVHTPQWLRRPTPSILRLHEQDANCNAFPDPGNIAIAVKTGATEAVEKIPMLMRTTLRCAQNVVIFSDLEQNIAGHQLHDALKDIPRAAMDGNSDFEFYWKLKEAKKYGQIEKMLRGAHDPRVKQDLASWTLDKYKQLHILEKLYAAHPDKDWYLMMDADTYVVWPNLLAWLRQLPDPTADELYLGSPAEVGDVKFAHGGSGIFLSQATMYKFAVTNKGMAAKWDKPMHDECCGDYVIGSVLKGQGILLKTSWPTVNGEKPSTLPFGPTHWCQPIVTMHHADSYEMNQLANFELARNNTQVRRCLCYLTLPNPRWLTKR